MGCCGAWLQAAFGEREEVCEGGDLSYRRSLRCPASCVLCWRFYCAVCTAQNLHCIFPGNVTRVAWLMAKHCTLWVLRAPAWLLPPSLPPQDQPWHLPSNDQVHLLPKKYCWLFLNVLRAPTEIPNGRYDCREHSVCCVLQQLRRSRALQGSPGADHGGCCAVGMGRSQREENLQAGLFFFNFCPPKICSLKKNYNFFFDSLIK